MQSTISNSKPAPNEPHVLTPNEVADRSAIWATLHAVLSVATSRGTPASPRTLESYKSVIGRLLQFTGKPWEALTYDDYQDYVRHRRKTLATNSTAVEDKNLRAICSNTGRGTPLCQSLTTARRLKTKQANRRKLSEADAKSLLSSTREVLGYRAWVLIKVMLGTGMRASEVVNARKENYQGGVLLLEATKGDKPRAVYISSALQSIITKYSKAVEGAWLFGRLDGEQENRRYLHRMVKRAGEIAGITELGPHMLRRTYGTIAHSRGAPLKFIQQQYGHSSVMTTMRYIDIDGVGAQEMANEFGDI